MLTITDLQEQLPDKPGQHFCIAPFLSIRQNAHGRNSPCAYGAGEWRHENLSAIERWDSKELNQLRKDFIDGQQPKECFRCWDEEDSGKQSLRQRQLQYFPDDYQKFILSGEWMQGPKTAVFKTSNVCNLACRSCGGWDSNTFTQEGLHYAETYQTLANINGSIQKHNRFIPLLQPKHMNFMQYTDLAGNLEKIDFFGGEPFLNTSQLDLLEYLVQQGISKKITLFYSTNCTNHPTKRLKKAWNNFKRVEISLSIDGVGDHFEYLRWPGKWNKSVEVFEHINELKNQLDCEIYIMAGYTMSLLNVYYADETCEWLQKYISNIYVSMVNSPEYLSLHIAPDSVKLNIRNHVKHSEVAGYIDLKPHNPLAWKQFIIWTKRQDIYRQQNFTSTFPEFYEIIQKDWDSITDLSEQNFLTL
jgi:hypothetical protein